MRYFEHLIESGDWKEAEQYLLAFVGMSCEILYRIQMQSILEAARVAVQKVDDELDIGDKESARCKIIDKVKELTVANFKIPEKLNFPEDSCLWKLFSQKFISSLILTLTFFQYYNCLLIYFLLSTNYSDPGLDHNLIPRTASQVGHDIRCSEGGSGGCKTLCVNKLVIYTDKVLGVGMTSSAREGIYDGRKVTVKRLYRTEGIDISPTEEVDFNPKEVESLIEADSHENIVTYYGKEVDDDCFYLALELCSCTLDELIRGKNNAGIDLAQLRKEDYYPSSKLLGIMRDVICGLAHLHKLRYIHRDLKPSNILIKQDGHLCAKITDMGMSKRLRADSSSGTNSTTSCIDGGQRPMQIYNAPEQLYGSNRVTRAADMFSLGCILFFCITKGEHPFGDTECLENILRDDKSLFEILEDFPEACDIIGLLLSQTAAERPPIEEVKRHPFLWESSSRLQFLRTAFDTFKSENDKAKLEGIPSQLLLGLETISTTVFGNRWDNKLDSPFVTYLNSGEHGYYDYFQVYDLLRLIRNKSSHWRELPEDVRSLMSQPVTRGIEIYFSRKFPKLLFEVYKIIGDFCPDELNFNNTIVGIPLSKMLAYFCKWVACFSFFL